MHSSQHGALEAVNDGERMWKHTTRRREKAYGETGMKSGIDSEKKHTLCSTSTRLATITITDNL